MAKIFGKLIFGGLHEKHALQRGIWVPTQHSLWDHGKPGSSWPVAGPSRCKLTTSQQSGVEYASPNIVMRSQSQSQSQSYFTTDGQSVSMSWCRDSAFSLTRIGADLTETRSTGYRTPHVQICE
jgi:hypothetical protein